MKTRNRFVAGALVCALAAPALAESGEGAQALASTRDTLAKWVETQQILSKEKRDWQLGREVLEQRIELLSNEISALETKVAAGRAAIAEADHERSDLARRDGALKSSTQNAAAKISALETGTLALLRAAPPVLAERVAPLRQRIPRDAARTTLSLAERWQNVIGILNEVNKFDREITVISEVRELPGGGTAEVKSLYLGLGQAYYVTPAGDAAGTGRPGPDGFEWTAADVLAGEISRAIAILHNEDVPAYVPLPVEIR